MNWPELFENVVVRGAEILTRVATARDYERVVVVAANFADEEYVSITYSNADDTELGTDITAREHEQQCAGDHASVVRRKCMALTGVEHGLP